MERKKGEKEMEAIIAPTRHVFRLKMNKPQELHKGSCRSCCLVWRDSSIDVGRSSLVEYSEVDIVQFPSTIFCFISVLFSLRNFEKPNSVHIFALDFISKTCWIHLKIFSAPEWSSHFWKLVGIILIEVLQRGNSIDS